ncbi:hypothetical protein ACIRRA_28370 [Nocardia sp. NPDC101769]|uniref:hypothetical protein n=1 Tax=Nocardia sp. NPDC101769 TaxID=3364333 RepID=UPI003819E8CD
MKPLLAYRLPTIATACAVAAILYGTGVATGAPLTLDPVATTTASGSADSGSVTSGSATQTLDANANTGSSSAQLLWRQFWCQYSGGDWYPETGYCQHYDGSRVG